MPGSVLSTSYLLTLLLSQPPSRLHNTVTIIPILQMGSQGKKMLCCLRTSDTEKEPDEEGRGRRCHHVAPGPGFLSQTRALVRH